MTDKIKILKKERDEAQKKYELSLPTTSLSEQSPKGKTVAEIKLPKLIRDRAVLYLKIEEAREDKDPDWRIKELEQEVSNLQAQITAYKNGETPSKRYSK